MNALVERRIQDLLNTKTRQILGIVGAPGSGKSTLTAQIAEHFGDAVVVVPMDGFHLANRELARRGLSARKGAPETFDVFGYLHLLQRIAKQTSDETIYAPVFERAIEEAIASSIAVDFEAKLVVTEGNYLLLGHGGWQNIRPLLNQAWYVDVDDALRLSRLTARHMQYGRSEAAATAWIQSTDEPNARLIEASKHLADWHVAV